MPHKMGDKPGDSGTIMAAGTVAWRPGDAGQPEILLVHRTKYDDWSLPKGKQEPGEQLPVTAVRETSEETGARVTLGRRLRPTRYAASGRPKLVSYWSARATGADDGAVPNHEVDAIAWLPVAEAAKRLSYAHDAGVLDDFAAVSPRTVPLILLRHAKALPRSGWPGEDADRPLDDSGEAEAKVLAGLLACFAPAARVVSSDTVRCLETVRPYAELTGAPVQATVTLRISGTDPADSQAVAVRAVAAGTPTVICAHRENLRALVGAAAGALGAPGVQACCDEPMATGGFCILHMAGGTLAGADGYDLSGT